MTSTAKTAVTVDNSLLVANEVRNAADVTTATNSLLDNDKEGWASVSANDTHVKHLEDALVAGAGITITKNNPGGDETLTLSALAIKFNARLTLETGVPVSSTAQVDKTTLYLTSFRGNAISVYDGSNWIDRTLSADISIATSHGDFSAQDKPYDIFVYWTGSALALNAVVWTNDTTRATALATQDNIYVKSGAATYRYVGTVRLYGAASKYLSDSGVGGVVAGRPARRYVHNYYNQVEREFIITDNTDSWAQQQNDTWRQQNANSNNQCDFVIGIVEAPINAVYYALLKTATGNYGVAGIGLNSITSPSSQARQDIGATDPQVNAIAAAYSGYPSIGRNYIAPLEYSYSNTSALTWYGDAGTTSVQTSTIGRISG